MGTMKGAYIALKEQTEQPGTIIISSGSELILALQAAKELGPDVRVVSMPSMFRFNKQDAAYQESILPASCTRRLAIEAGKTDLWYRYVGPQGCIIGIDSYGFSAPGDVVLHDLGMNVENIIAHAKAL
jgi:transketolase